MIEELDYPQTIRTKINSLGVELQNAIESIPHVIFAEKVAQKFKFLCSATPRIVYYSSTNTDILLQLKDFRSVVPILKFFKDAGYGRTSTDRGAGSMTYIFGCLWLIITTAKDAKCGWVQTGTKTIEKPIMELICE